MVCFFFHLTAYQQCLFVLGTSPFSWAVHVPPVSKSVKLGWKAIPTPLLILRCDKRKIQFMTIACCYSQSSVCFFQISLGNSEEWRRKWSECLRHHCLGVQKPETPLSWGLEAWDTTVLGFGSLLFPFAHLEAGKKNGLRNWAQQTQSNMAIQKVYSCASLK